MPKIMPVTLSNYGENKHKPKLNRNSTESALNSKAKSFNNKMSTKDKVVQKMSKIKNNYMSS